MLTSGHFELSVRSGRGQALAASRCRFLPQAENLNSRHLDNVAALRSLSNLFLLSCRVALVAETVRKRSIATVKMLKISTGQSEHQPSPASGLRVWGQQQYIDLVAGALKGQLVRKLEKCSGAAESRKLRVTGVPGSTRLLLEDLPLCPSEAAPPSSHLARGFLP